MSIGKNSWIRIIISIDFNDIHKSEFASEFYVYIISDNNNS